MFFRGRSQRTPDPKGRLMLPTEFRDIIRSQSEEGKVVLTTYDGCIVGFPYPEWEIFEQKLSSVSNPTRAVRDFRRLVLGGASIMSLDAQGRIRLSREQMQYAGIDKDVYVVGQGPRFEVWAPSELDALLTQNFDDVAEAIADAGVDFGF